MSDITFTPIWLLLLPVIAFLAWRCPQLGLRRPARILAVLCLILLLCRPAIPTRSGGMDLWVLLDRSVSTGGLVERQRREWRDLLMDAKPGVRDTIHFIDYAEDAVPALDGGGSELAPSLRNQTRLANAVEYVLSNHDETRPTRLLVLSDGYSTEPLGKIASRLSAMGIPLDHRLIEPPASEDYRITALEGPTRVQAGEAFLIRARIAGFGGEPDAKIPISLLRDGQVLARSTIVMRDGTGSVEWADRINSGGSHQYEVQIQPEKDAYIGNNRAGTWVEISAGPRILVISRHPDDPLAKAFEGQGLEADLITEPSIVTPAHLTGAKAVVLHNVPSHDLQPSFLKSLDFFVRHQGGGLMMVGGRHSFGAGGYFQSSIDELLPVSMELKADHRKLAVAMVIVLDRSGSMSASAVGAPGITKMDLANQGSVAAIELLGVRDAISVLAVDDKPHTMVPMTMVGKNRMNLINKVRRIQSSGGGIYVYEGLKGAADQLKKATAGTRHIILFADASDAEEPGAYKTLIKQLTDEGTTISVVGLGTDKDPDAALLKDIARLGNGRVHFAENANDLPKLFAGETVAVARSAFITDPTGLMATGEWREISSLPIEWPAKLDGYNLSYARPGSSVAAISTDEFNAPLIATIRRGLGRTAAVSFPMAGKNSEIIRAWPGYNGFTRTLGRWLSGNPLPAGIGLSHRTEGSRLTLNLHYDVNRWNERMTANPPRLFVASGEIETDAREITWTRLAPGHFSSSFELREDELLRGVVQIGDHTLPFGPLSVPLSAEWAFDPASQADLRLASQLSGGVERSDLSTAWQRPPVVQYSDLRMHLGTLALLFILFDAYSTKTGFKLPLPSVPKLPKRKTKAKTRKRRPKPETEKPVATEKEAPTPQPEENQSEQRRSRFMEAKRMRRK